MMSEEKTVRGERTTAQADSVTNSCDHSTAVRDGILHPMSGLVRGDIPNIHIGTMAMIEATTPPSAR
jgi:hypothetical protein